MASRAGRRRLNIWAKMGLGAALGLAAATQLQADQAARFGVWLAVAGAALGAVHSFWRLPDAPTCRIPWWLGGCGGESTVRDTAGNSRPKRPCWGHPDGKPKRLVNIAVVAGEIGLVVGLVVVLVAVAGGGR